VVLNIGYPPKLYDLDIDSGSDITWVQCDAPCKGCTKVCNAYTKIRPVSEFYPQNQYSPGVNVCSLVSNFINPITTLCDVWTNCVLKCTYQQTIIVLPQMTNVTMKLSMQIMDHLWVC